MLCCRHLVVLSPQPLVVPANLLGDTVVRSSVAQEFCTGHALENQCMRA